MTDAQKIDALSDLLSNVIHSLEMTKYEIEDVSEAANVVRDADHYHQQMLDILHSNWIKQNVHNPLFYALSTTVENAIILYIRWSKTYGWVLQIMWKSCWTD